MSYLHPEEPSPLAIAMWNGNLFLPPPGVDPVVAYTKVFSACFAIWGHAIILCAMLGMCGTP